MINIKYVSNMFHIAMPSKNSILDLIFSTYSRSSIRLVSTIEKSPLNNQDTFGTYSETKCNFETVKDDSEDISEKIRKTQSDRQQSSYYVNTIKSYLENHQFEKALNFLNERMLQVDRVRPDTFVYDLLISYCGRRGDVKEAFKLYNNIKKRGQFVTGGQYTSLFNACANCSQSHYALEVATKIRRGLVNNEIHKPNIKNYNAMLKAFGRHGDLRTCLSIIDEVIERRRKVRDDTYNFLLQACISDANSGFRHALLVWHRMLVNKTDPSVYSFNLMLRAVRDCSLGIPEEIKPCIQEILEQRDSRKLRKLVIQPASGTLLLIPFSRGGTEEKRDSVADHCQSENLLPVKSEDVEQKSTNSVQMDPTSYSLSTEISTHLPNLLAVQPTEGSALQLNTFTTPYHRLLLLGGVTGVIKVMDSLKIKPDVKTFTLLLDIVPSCNRTEEELISISKSKEVALDTGFFNLLIKKRSIRCDYKGALNVLSLMQLYGSQPDLTTFGVLALTCRTLEDSQKLIQTIREAGFRTNSQILTPLARQAAYQENLPFIRWIILVIKEDDVQPGGKLMATLNDFMRKKSTSHTLGD